MFLEEGCFGIPRVRGYSGQTNERAQLKKSCDRNSCFGGPDGDRRGIYVYGHRGRYYFVVALRLTIRHWCAAGGAEEHPSELVTRSAAASISLATTT